MRLHAFLSLLLFATSATGYAQYRFVDLHPLGTGNPSAVQGAAAGQQGGRYQADNQQHAALWSSTQESFKSLRPGPQYVSSGVLGVAQGHQVGHATLGGDVQRAAMWNCAAATFRSFGPAYSIAIGASTNLVVGMAPGNFRPHAALWQGESLAYVDLHPTGLADQSYALATTDRIQVGHTSLDVGAQHAALWRCSAESYQDLNPDGIEQSAAFGTSDTFQVGYARDLFFRGDHACLWRGRAGSFVDLDPLDSYQQSRALATSNFHQVGYIVRDGTPGAQATRWSGTAESMVDLHGFAPSRYIETVATGIDTVTGDIVGTAYDSVSRQNHAVLWQAVPEPASILSLGSGALLFFLRMRRGRP